MSYQFLFFVVLLVAFVIYFQTQFYKKKWEFEGKIKVLQAQIEMMEQKSIIQNQKIALLNELNSILKVSNQNLNNSIFNFNFEMLEEIYPKK